MQHVRPTKAMNEEIKMLLQPCPKEIFTSIFLSTPTSAVHWNRSTLVWLRGPLLRNEWDDVKLRGGIAVPLWFHGLFVKYKPKQFLAEGWLQIKIMGFLIQKNSCNLDRFYTVVSHQIWNALNRGWDTFFSSWRLVLDLPPTQCFFFLPFFLPSVTSESVTADPKLDILVMEARLDMLSVESWRLIRTSGTADR